MYYEILITLISTTLIGIFFELFQRFGLKLSRKIFGIEEPKHETISEKLHKSINLLDKTSKDVENLLYEVSSDLKKREQAITKLQSENENLIFQEEELKSRINALKDVPIEVAEYFQQINQRNLEQLDRSNSKRDFLIFFFGILASAMVSVALRLLGWA